jgi:dolichol-phosphate mannosyltransferase
MLTHDEAPEPGPPGMLSVIIPVHNEVSSIERVIRSVQELTLLKEIIVVDDGSTDGTRGLLSKLPPASNLKILLHERKRGKGAVIRSALASASGEFVVIQDADLEYDPSDLPALIAPLAAGETDVVYGVRQHDSAARGLALYVGSRMLTVLTNLLYGSRIHDEATCYKAFRRTLLNRIVLEGDGFDFCPEVTAKICRLGKEIREVPISYHPRSATQGKKLRLSDGFAAVLTLLRYRFEPRSRFDRAFNAECYGTAGAIGETVPPAETGRMAQAPLAIASVVITLAALGSWLWFSKVRYFDPDELEHLHFAWCISKGMVPYRDFFEHHTPWFHYGLAALMPFYQVDRRFDDALAFICLARRIDLILAAAALALTFLLARLWRGSSTGWIAIALLAVTPVFARKTFEIRPDVLAIVLWLGCLVALVRALSGAPLLSARRRAQLFALSGLLLGSAIMSTQKLLMVMPSFAFAMLWYVAAGQGQRRTRLREVGLLFAGFAVPVLATLGYFWSQGALGEFIYFNLTLNMHWKFHRSPFHLLNLGFAENPSLLVFGGLGLILEGFRESRQRAFSVGKLLILSAAGLIAGLWEMPVAQEQYYLTFLPLLAIFSARFMVGVAAAVSREHSTHDRSGMRYVIAIAFLSGTIAMLMIWASPDTRWLKMIVVLLLAAGTLLMFHSRGTTALAVLLCALCICPYYLARNRFLDDNSYDLQSLRFAIEKTSPTDTMMDGFTGFGVFRPHAYFYWFLHPEIVEMITDEQRRQLLADFQAGKIAPRYILLDSFLASVLFPIQSYVLDNYRVVPYENPKICKRRTLSP